MSKQVRLFFIEKIRGLDPGEGWPFQRHINNHPIPLKKKKYLLGVNKIIKT